MLDWQHKTADLPMPVVQSRHGRTMHKRNAQLGLKTLLSSGIEVIAMLQESWTKLAEFADIELPKYLDSARQKLDKHIDNFLSKMKRIQNATDCCTGLQTVSLFFRSLYEWH